MPEFLHRFRKPLGILLVVIIAALAIAALHHLAQEVKLQDIRSALTSIAPGRIALAVAFTVLSYFALTIYDVLALRIIGRSLPWKTAATASFTSYTLSHNLGFSALTGGAARYRVYSAAGLDGPDVARIVAIAGAAFWGGVLFVAAIALVSHQGPLAIGGVTLSRAFTVIAGLGIVAAFSFVFFSIARGKSEIILWKWKLPLPDLKQAFSQILFAAIDLAAASAALFVLLPDTAASAFPAFFLIYSLAIIIAIVSSVPGGIGVFEAIVVATVPGDKAVIFAALILYRMIYYIIPLGISSVWLAIREGSRVRAPISRALSGAQAVASGMAPIALGASVFGGGVILLVSGSLPALPERISFLHDFLPLPFIEASHIAASLVGTALLLLAHGLYRRLDGAFVATRALLIAGAVFSLAKGFDYEEAIICLLIAALLQWTRPAFYRRSGLTGRILSPRWIAAVGLILLAVTWLGFFAYKHVDYQDSLWWDFALHADASRFLRASVAIAILLLVAALWRLLSPPAQPVVASTLDDDIWEQCLAQADRTDAMLARTGDKRFLLSESGNAFLMYQVSGKSWIVMADPVGSREEWPELFWSMRKLADAEGGRLLFYQLSTEALPLAIELGFQIIKYGEEARISLSGFSLEGSRMSKLRQAHNRSLREGSSFEIVPATSFAEIVDEIAIISDDWLRHKKAREKMFSLGRFDRNYLADFDTALVRREGRIIAFANLWATPNRNELSIDLMRHGEDMPPGTMDFLFTELILWGQQQEYQWFTLGIAPLSGIEANRLSPVWAKAASFLFRHGEQFYGFRGLRSYKDKFAPQWEGRYIAVPRGLGWLTSLGDLQALIGGKNILKDKDQEIPLSSRAGQPE
jgi:phosphatidylglycerol lysyltransferase